MAYQPTVRSAKRAYTELNRQLFDGQLPPSNAITFEIGNITLKWWAYCVAENDYIKIKLLPQYKNRKFFVNILAHEMVHVWEHLNYNKMTHGPRFFEFKEVFIENGFDLSGTYSHEDFV